MTDDLRPDPNSQYGSTPPPTPAMPTNSDARSDSAPMDTDSNARTIGMLCHLLALVQFLGIPGFIGPLALWLIKREEHPFIDRNGKEALNFQLSVLIYLVVSTLLALLVIGFLMLIAVMILNIVYTVIAAIKASEGKDYQYPFTIRFIK